MVEAVPEVINVLLFSAADDRTVSRIESVVPGRVRAHPVWDDFQPELAEEWPAETLQRWGSKTPPSRSRTELESLIEQANVAYLGVPWPIRVAERMPNLMWAHMPGAGVTNLRDTSWWQGPAALTSARGGNGAVPIAESAMAGAFMLARRLDTAVRQTDAGELLASAYRGQMSVLQGKTMGIVGLGGIGSEVARIASGVGMRVVATRNSAKERLFEADGVDVLYPPSETNDMLAESDFVAVCAMWTPQTERMLNKASFAAMKPGAFFLNVARGEIVDEPAMVEALHSGRLAGAYIDVWTDDTQSPPIPELLSAPNIIITPHITIGSDGDHRRGMDIFCDNLGRLVRGEELVNLVDWERGY